MNNLYTSISYMKIIVLKFAKFSSRTPLQVQEVCLIFLILGFPFHLQNRMSFLVTTTDDDKANISIDRKYAPQSRFFTNLLEELNDENPANGDSNILII